MAERKPYLLRIDPTILDALRRWADDELRSLNGQIEFLLRERLEAAGRMKNPAGGSRRTLPSGEGQPGHRAESKPSRKPQRDE